MATIARQPLTTNYNYNQIGHFKELVAGAGSKVFKVNSAGIFAGAASYGSAPFQLSYAGALNATGVTISGVITATSGSITGDMVVTGSLYSDLSGKRTKLADGKISFLSSTTEKGFIKQTNDNGLTLASNGSVYFTDLSGNPNAELTSDSNLKFSNNAYISWSSGRKITATASNINIDGYMNVSENIQARANLTFTSDGYIKWGSGRSINATGTELECDGNFVPHENINHDLGSASRRWNNVRAGYAIIDNRIQCQGYNGVTQNYGVVRRVDHDGGGHVTDVKYVEIRTKGGIIYQFAD